MSAKKSKTFFKTLTAILVLLLFFGGYYIYSSGIFGASVTENISEHSITDMPVQTTKQNVRHWKKPLYVWNYLALRIGSRTLILLHGFYPLAKRNILCTVEQRKNSFSPLFLGGAIHI